ncbi:MAG: cation-translocating P-type ATPase, partial [Candidatus Limnocylindrales bacterium]
ILAIVILNAVLGFAQEYRAEKAMLALKRLAVPAVKARRGGRVREISARDLMPGDIVLLDAGNFVPADCRLLEGSSLRIQEAALTGESEPVDKDPRPLAETNLPLATRCNMLYMGTVITYGRGVALVTATGMQTELGQIATMIQRVQREQTPLQRRLDQLGKWLALTALVIVAIVSTLGLLRGEEPKLLFLTAISLAVAAVPEGLPAVVTIALALGAQRMLKRRALIRRLAAVETLGSVTVICSDKTGTLTENRMSVVILDVAGHRLDLAEHLQHAEPDLSPDEPRLALPKDRPAVAALLAGCALCNDAVIEADPQRPGHFYTLGDPTEAALVVAAARFGLWKEPLDDAFPRVAEAPFDSVRKRMTTVHRLDGRPSTTPETVATLRTLVHRLGEAPALIAVTKGAVESVLDVSSAVWVNGKAERLTDVLRDQVLTTNNQLTRQGMRVLGVGWRALDDLPGDFGAVAERDLVFLGMVAMIDPPRPLLKGAVATCKSAGIRPVMITGDHELTAQQIARDLGIATDGQVLTGQELDRLTVEELESVAEDVAVYARVSPEHKLKVVQALQNRGHVVAMTGDGVNDAPALRKANIGVAMGVVGTDVAKEAADVVLLDDDFATIVAATEEGRVIYDNIRKFIRYLLTTNLGELWLMLLAPLTGMPLPLLPLQILWINLVTDGLPALALGFEPAEANVMRRPPHPPEEGVFSRGLARHILIIGLLMGLVSLGVGYALWHDLQPNWRTMAFMTITLSQLAHVLAIRSEHASLFTIGLGSNKPLLGAVALTCVLQVAITYVPPFQAIFGTTALSATELVIAVALSTIVFWAVELEKWLIRRTGQT